MRIENEPSYNDNDKRLPVTLLSGLSEIILGVSVMIEKLY